MGLKFVDIIKNQMPAAHAERYEKTFINWADKLGEKRPELAEKLRPHIETAAKVAGVATTVGEIALFVAALYGGYAFLHNPAAAIAAIKASWATVVTGAGVAAESIKTGATQVSEWVHKILNPPKIGEGLSTLKQMRFNR